MGKTWTWRDAAIPLIKKTLEDNAGKTEKEIRAALREAYPWGERAMHPYKIWCDEVKIQLGKKQRKKSGRQKYASEDPNQLNLL